MYDDTIPLPTVNMELWEKVHGTNAAVNYSNLDGFWVQSKGTILTPGKDNHATSKMAYENEDEWIKIIQSLAK